MTHSVCVCVIIQLSGHMVIAVIFLLRNRTKRLDLFHCFISLRDYMTMLNIMNILDVDILMDHKDAAIII